MRPHCAVLKIGFRSPTKYSDLWIVTNKNSNSVMDEGLGHDMLRCISIMLASALGQAKKVTGALNLLLAINYVDSILETVSSGR